MIHRPENIRYLTGYTGEGSLLITPRRQIILTDFRYVEQAERQAPQCEYFRTRNGPGEGEFSNEVLLQENLTAMAVETDFLTCDEFWELSRALPGIELKPLQGLVDTLREVKDASEIACIREAAKIACKAFDGVLSMIRPGVTEREIMLFLDFEMRRLGSEANAFDTIVASGENGSLCHAVPSDRKVSPGELITMDFGAKIGGYCSDMTRTVCLGKPSPALRALYQTVLDAQLLALAAVAPGKSCKAIDKIARDFIDKKYPGAFGHSLGHGVGLQIHEQPRLSQTCENILRPGNVVTVEPGIYLPGTGGCRIEDMVILTEDGFENPVTAAKELIEL